jgi:hypothetical protein
MAGSGVQAWLFPLRILIQKSCVWQPYLYQTAFVDLHSQSDEPSRVIINAHRSVSQPFFDRIAV